jgi:hypothetical protein
MNQIPSSWQGLSLYSIAKKNSLTDWLVLRSLLVYLNNVPLLIIFNFRPHGSGTATIAVVVDVDVDMDVDVDVDVAVVVVVVSSINVVSVAVVGLDIGFTLSLCVIDVVIVIDDVGSCKSCQCNCLGRRLCHCHLRRSCCSLDVVDVAT